MPHSYKNNKIKHLHKLCLRLIYSDKKSSSGILLEKDNSVSIHQALAIETFKVNNKLCPEIISDTFMERTISTISTICVMVLILQLLK